MRARDCGRSFYLASILVEKSLKVRLGRPEPRGEEVGVAIRRRILLQAVGVWLLLLGFAVINGLFRQTVLEPNLGPEPAHVLSTTTLAGAVFLAALLFFGWGPGGDSTAELLAIGALWAFLTTVVELGLGFARGVSSEDLLRDYDVTRGRLFGLVLLAELFSPLIAGFLRRLGR